MLIAVFTVYNLFWFSINVCQQLILLVAADQTTISTSYQVELDLLGSPLVVT